MSKITVYLKPTFGGDKFPCEIEPSQSVRELKEVVASQSSPQVTVVDQRLIYKGQVLKDERTVESYGTSAFPCLHAAWEPCIGCLCGKVPLCHRPASGARHPPGSTTSRPEVRDVSRGWVVPWPCKAHFDSLFCHTTAPAGVSLPERLCSAPAPSSGAATPGAAAAAGAAAGGPGDMVGSLLHRHSRLLQLALGS